LKILIVDDSSTMRRVIIGSLIKLHYKKEDFDEASDGIEAWQLLKENEYNLILTDWNMPNLCGYELVKKIKYDENKNRNTPIIMITTEGNQNEVIKALKIGVSNYIVKPLKHEQLAQKVLQLLL
jgi:two-component system chemotaxis response regulator CheY